MPCLLSASVPPTRLGAILVPLHMRRRRVGQALRVPHHKLARRLDRQRDTDVCALHGQSVGAEQLGLCCGPWQTRCPGAIAARLHDARRLRMLTPLSPQRLFLVAARRRPDGRHVQRVHIHPGRQGQRQRLPRGGHALHDVRARSAAMPCTCPHTWLCAAASAWRAFLGPQPCCLLPPLACRWLQARKHQLRPAAHAARAGLRSCGSHDSPPAGRRLPCGNLPVHGGHGGQGGRAAGPGRGSGCAPSPPFPRPPSWAHPMPP